MLNDEDPEMRLSALSLLSLNPLKRVDEIYLKVSLRWSKKYSEDIAKALLKLIQNAKQNEAQKVVLERALRSFGTQLD